MTWRDDALRRFYDPNRGFVDGTTEFHQICARVIPAGGRILEIGAGPSNPTSDFLATHGGLTGLDVDPDVRNNRALTASAVFDGGAFPFPDGSFDACVSNYVLEHVARPDIHLAEVRRVLVPGGVYAIRTPNLYHYVAMVAWLTPHWFHQRVANRLRDLPADAHDPYPTVYAMNTPRTFRNLARAADLDVAELHMVEKEPSYGMASPLVFYPFLAYERLVNSSRVWEPLRANIFAVLRRH